MPGRMDPATQERSLPKGKSGVRGIKKGPPKEGRKQSLSIDRSSGTVRARKPQKKVVPPMAAGLGVNLLSHNLWYLAASCRPSCEHPTQGDAEAFSMSNPATAAILALALEHWEAWSGRWEGSPAVEVTEPFASVLKPICSEERNTTSQQLLSYCLPYVHPGCISSVRLSSNRD